MNLFKITPRQWLIVAHDLVVTAAALVATLMIRFEGQRLVDYLSGLLVWLAPFIVYAGVVYFLIGLQRSKWRFTSLQ